MTGKAPSNHRKVLRINIIDTSPVLRTFILSLLVQAQWIDGLEIEVQKEFKAHDRRIVLDAYRLCKAGITVLHLLVGRVRETAVRKTGLGLHDAPDLLEIVLGAPEAPACNIDFLE